MSTLEHLSQRNKNFLSHKICPCTVIGALFVIARNWKHLRCSSMNEWLMKLWYIHNTTQSVEYYSAKKRKKLLIYTATWMNLQRMLNEKIQSMVSASKVPSLCLIFLLASLTSIFNFCLSIGPKTFPKFNWIWL